MTAHTVLYIRSIRGIIKLFLLIVIQNVCFVNFGYAQTDELQQIMQARIVQLQDTNSLYIDGEKIAATRLITELYTKNNYSLAWQNANKQDELINIISHIDSEGLNLDDYLLHNLRKYRDQDAQLISSEQVDFDILLTESLVRLAYHLRFGKVNPESLEPNWNMDRGMGNEDPFNNIQAIINSDSIQAYIDQAIPRQPFYDRYKKALAYYRKILEEGGWPTVPSGPALKPGMNDPGIKLLKQRLQIEGYLQEPLSDATDYFDVSLEDAVKDFQQRHGLDTDGVVGKQTLEAMNVSVEDRIDQIRVNLERGRWVLKDVQGEFLIVNIAGFKAYLVRDNNLIWTSRVIVGRTYRKTPVFKSAINYMIFNPTWTVPPGILRNDVLPKARKDPAYITDQRFEVLDREGKKVDPGNLDWSAFTVKNFPYTLRQEAGPDNALGRIKFVFPNSHFVYLHDTPHKELFGNPERTFSSGCIRVENPVQLAEILLNDREKWSRQKIEEAIATNKTQTIHLQKPVTIMLLYWTVVIEPDGIVNFRKDIYDRDNKVLKALNGEFSFSLPSGLPERYYN